jgi:hypothetical protein
LVDRSTIGKMPDPAPILDYASPQRRRRLALPVDTRLDLETSPNQVSAVARLHGRAGAVGAILFACFILILYGAIIFEAPRNPGIALVLLFWLGYAALLALVIHNTWRSTILTADPEHLRLTFTTPWSRRHLEWTADQVAQIDVVPILLFSGSSDGTGEMLITIRNGSPLRLFGGHREQTLSDVAHELSRVLFRPLPRAT